MLMWIINMQKTWSNRWGNVKVQYNKYTDVCQWKLHSIYISIYVCLTRNYYFHRLWAANSPWRSWDVTKASPLLLAPLSAGDALWAARTQLTLSTPTPILPGPSPCQDPHPARSSPWHPALPWENPRGHFSCSPWIRSAGKARDSLFVISIYRHQDSVKKI